MTARELIINSSSRDRIEREFWLKCFFMLKQEFEIFVGAEFQTERDYVNENVGVNFDPSYPTFCFCVYRRAARFADVDWSGEIFSVDKTKEQWIFPEGPNIYADFILFHRSKRLQTTGNGQIMRFFYSLREGWKFQSWTGDQYYEFTDWPAPIEFDK